ncbi:MAG: hypothetical protein N3A69_00750 [Leptospiraceae bacterium]|nr:hypothetical protein [Leptospiraceae bacterium]
MGILFCFFFSNILFAQANNLNSFGDTPWGTPFQIVRDKYESLARNPNSKENIQILNEVKNKLLIVKRNNVMYIYRFYKEPKEVSEVKVSQGETQKQDHKAASGLFSVGVVFSPVESTRAKNTLKEKYGNPSREYLVENNFGVVLEKEVVVKTEKKAEDGEEVQEEEKVETSNKIPAALIWNLTNETEGKVDGGYIIQWNEPYQKKLYTKRMDYFSAELSKIINSDYKEYFSNRETKIIFDLLTTPPSLQMEKTTEVPTK